MAYGVILKHLVVDRTTWGGHFLKKNLKKRRTGAAPFKMGG
jgi:hypothetical protein